MKAKAKSTGKKKAAVKKQQAAPAKNNLLVKEVTSLLNGLNSKLKHTVAKQFNESLASEVKTWVPTGIPTVDMLFGGGLPVGKVIELHGAPKCGKSTIALQACINARKLGGWVLYLDTEHTLEKDRAVHMGVDLADPLFTVFEPTTIEEGFRCIHHLLKEAKSNEVFKDIPFFFIVWDTITQTVSEAEYDPEKGEFKHDMGRRAVMTRKYLRVLVDACATTNLCFVSLNHETENIAAQGKGRLWSTPGGTGFKYASSLVARLIPVQGKAERWMVDNNPDGDQLGHPVKFNIIHTRLSPPKREITAMLNFYSGFDAALSSLMYIKKSGMVEKRGNNYVFRVPDRDEILISTGPAGEKKFSSLWNEDEAFREFAIASMKKHYEQIIPWKNVNFNEAEGAWETIVDEEDPAIPEFDPTAKNDSPEEDNSDEAVEEMEE